MSALRCHVRADALDLGCLVLDVRANCLLLMAVPSACSCCTTASVLGCSGTSCSFLCDVFRTAVVLSPSSPCSLLSLSCCSLPWTVKFRCCINIIIFCLWTSVAVLKESSSFNLDSNLRLFFRLSLSLLDLFCLSRVTGFLALSSSLSVRRRHRFHFRHATCSLSLPRRLVLLCGVLGIASVDLSNCPIGPFNRLDSVPSLPSRTSAIQL